MTDREWYKQHGICPTCRKEKAAPGRVHCLNCLDYMKNEGEWSRSNNSREQRRQYMKKKRELCIAFGICRECMCRKATEGLKCAACKAKERNNALAKSRRIQYEATGRCTLCGAERVEGYKVCARCLNKCRDVVKTRKKASNEGHIWRRIQSVEVMMCKK